MSTKRDYYEILGVAKNATEVEIKKAYRQMAIKFHPDKNPGNKEAEDKFKEAAEAYEVLSNAEKKARYDRFGHQGMGGAGGGQSHMNMDDIFSNFGDIFGEGHPFESFFGGNSGGRGGRRQKVGSSIRIKVELTLLEIATGVEKKLKVKKQVACNSCNGSGAKDSSSVKTCTTCNGSGAVRKVQQSFLGQIATTTTCPTCNGDGTTVVNKCGSCHGTGKTIGEEIVTIKIPAGVGDGMQMTVSGKGNAAERGGIPGDLIVQFEEKPDASLKRDGNNVLYECYISFPDAVTGLSVEIPTVDGKAKIPIKAGTQPGEILRLRGKGIPVLNGYGRGDQLVHINIWTPQKLSSEEKAMIEKLKSSENFKPKPTNQRGFFEKIKEFFS